MGPPMQQFLLSSDVTVCYCIPLDDGRMTVACCGSNIGGGEEELLR
jgi:hypothetical protein